MSRSKTIADMEKGETAVISGFSDDELSVKLLEMGLLPGTAVRFNFKAPFGDPICISISGYDLTLRMEEARVISIFD